MENKFAIPVLRKDYLEICGAGIRAFAGGRHRALHIAKSRIRRDGRDNRRGRYRHILNLQRIQRWDIAIRPGRNRREHNAKKRDQGQAQSKPMRSPDTFRASVHCAFLQNVWCDRYAWPAAEAATHQASIPSHKIPVIVRE